MVQLFFIQGCCQNKDNDISCISFSLSKRQNKINQAKQNSNHEPDDRIDTSRIGNLVCNEEVLVSKEGLIPNTIYLNVIESKLNLEGLSLCIQAHEKTEFFFGKANVIYSLNKESL